jgi:transcriptional regulator with XRE-family HTH domain
MEEIGMTSSQLVEATGLDRKLVEAIVRGNFTPSPEQRRRLAAAMGIATDEIAWGHAIAVQHIRGNGPQAGRST